MLSVNPEEYKRDPYHIFKKLRAESPLSRLMPNGYWMISRYDDVKNILKDATTFISSGISIEPEPEKPEFLLYTRGLIGTDKPDHTRLRRLISRAFTPMMVHSLEQGIRDICRSLIQKMQDKSAINFIEHFSSPLPIIVIAKLIGLDPTMMRTFKRWAEILITWRNLPPSSDILLEASKMHRYFSDIIVERQQHPSNDLISSLIMARDSQHMITSAEILSFIRLLLVAGSDTTTHLIGNTLLALVSHPDHFELLRSDPSMITPYIEETLRHNGPSLSLIRKVGEDTEIAGLMLKQGDIVLPLIASANHDESVFSNPEVFDVKRDSQKHIAFGTGIHHCIGSQLTRLQTRIALEEIIASFRKIERVDATIKYINSFFFRGASQIQMIFTK